MSKNAILSSLCMSLCAVAAGATFNVVDFGARVTDCLVTTNIQAAIDACHRAGGGEVIVPEGVFRTGGLELKSGVTLRLLDGATLEGSADCADYAYAGETRPWYRGLLRADGAQDIAVVGGRYSMIDGRNCFDPNGEESYRGPHAIRFTGCTNVTLKGYSVRDSANWAHALFRCANVKVEKVRVYGGHDGFDAHASSNVVVFACEFHVGDDAIAGFGNECMTVRDTILDSACSAARFGGRNCLFERCRMVSPGSFGHRWKLSAEDKRRAVNHGETLRHSGFGFTYYCDFRWGDVPRPENIVFRDCTFDHPSRFFSFNFDGRSQWCCNRPLASIAFENCEILGVQTLGRFYGGEEDPLSITLKNCRVTAAPGKQAQPVLSGYNFRKIRFENVSLEGFADPCVEKRSEGEVEIIGGTPVRVTYRKDPKDEIYTFEKAASLLAGMKADRAAFDGWMAANAARGEVWRRAHDAWRGASNAWEEGEFFRRYYGYCFNGAKGVVASKRAEGETSDVPFGAFVYALAQRSPIVARAALTDFIRASPHTPAAVAGAQEALRRLLLKGDGSAQGGTKVTKASKVDPFIENGSLKIAFGGEGDGFGIKAIENRRAAGGTFGNPTNAKDPRWQVMEGSPASPAVVRKVLGETSADFWEIQFRETNALGDVQKAVFIDNRSACRAKTWTKTATGAEFVWEGVKLPDGAADVKATVSFAPDGTSRWNLRCRAKSAKYTKFDTRFPIIRRVVKDGEADWLRPSHDLGARLVAKAAYDKRPLRDGYRILAFGCLAYAPMMTAFFKGEAGLYYGAHDPRGITKSLVVTPERDLAFWSPASDLDFEVTIAALKGDWWQAAYLYKRWALTAPWCAKGRIVDRADYPKRICEIPLWLNMHGDAIATSNALQLAKDVFPDFSTGIHWHRWQAVPWEIGQYPEYFPTVPYAKETIAYLRSIGQEPMVYTLPRLYSETLLSWHYAKADALYGPNGRYYVEKYGAFDPPPLVPMCMAQKTYQDVCVDYARRILDLGGRSIFLDQFASCAAHACYATNHAHKPGGGDWFYRGQHEISRRIHEDYVKAGAFTTAEGANDHFIDVIDGLLTVTPRHPGDVPFWHAVYNGYTTYFCTPENDADDADSFWAQQARDVMWGHTMGWFHPDILKRADKVALLRKLIDFRQANLDVLAYGELVGEVKLVGPVRKQPVTWLGRVNFSDWGNPKAKLSPPITGELPSVLAYEWKSGLTGQRVLLFANLTSKEQSVTFESDGARKSLILAPRMFRRL